MGNVLSFFTRRRQRRAERLYNEGHKALDAHDFENALTIGRKLRKVRYSGAYEIEGLAYIGLDRHEDAVRVLREGLALAPAAWPNWLLLGSCLSDLERYSEALNAYDRAYACDGADIGSIACKVGELRLARGEDVLAFAIDSWRRTRHAPLLALIREARPLRSDRAHYFRLLLHGTRFYQSVDVVADSPEEALSFVIELDPEHVVIDEATAVEPRPLDRKGVYRMMGRTYYEET